MAALALTLVLIAGPTVARADALGEVRIAVVSAQDGAPVPDVIVTLIGASIGAVVSLRTDARGQAVVRSMTGGPYRLILGRNGYEGYRDSIEVRPGQATQISVALQPLRTIASVHSHIMRRAFYDIISSSSAVRKFSPSLLEALDNLGGVSVTQVNGIGALLALRGQDASETKYEINGVPLAGSGAGLAVNTDLLAQATVDQQNDEVSFNYLNPTTTPSYSEQISAGGFGSDLTKVTAQGTSGVFGYALASTDRRQASILDGQIYADLSGESYRHSGTLDTRGTYAKVSMPLGDWVGSLQTDQSASASSPIPTYFAGNIPVGYGPGERTNTVSSNDSFTANGQLDSRGDGGSVFGTAFRINDTDDERSRVLQGASLPAVERDQSRGTDIGAAFMRSASYFTQQVTASRTSILQSYQVALSSPVSAATTTVTNDIAVDLSHTGGRGQQMNLVFDITAAPAGTQVEFRPSLHLRPSTSDDVTFSAIVGGKAISTSAVQAPAIDPSFASYDCDGRTISLQGPGDTNATPHSIGVTGGWVHQTHGGSVSLLGYATSVAGSLLTNASVPLSLEPVGYVSPAFVQSLQQGYASLGGCSGPAPPLSQIYFTENVAGVSALYDGFTVDVSRALSTGATIEVTYSATGARVLALDTRLEGPSSPYIVGAQLPNVAPYTFGATFDALLDRRGTEALLNYKVTGPNNVRNLPAYGEYSFGLVRPISRSASISLVATNLDNEYAGAFVSPRYAVGLPVISGATFATLAAPLRPATLFVQITFKQQHSDDF